MTETENLIVNLRVLVYSIEEMTQALLNHSDTTTGDLLKAQELLSKISEKEIKEKIETNLLKELGSDTQKQMYGYNVTFLPAAVQEKFSLDKTKLTFAGLGITDENHIKALLYDKTNPEPKLKYSKIKE